MTCKRDEHVTSGCVTGEVTGPYARDEVEAAERRAWAFDGEREYHFDGIHFWVAEDGGWSAVKPEAVPERGWRHRRGCTCAPCRARAAASRPQTEPQTAGESS